MSRKNSMRPSASTLSKLSKAEARGWKPGAGPISDFLKRRKRPGQLIITGKGVV